ncbi:MAG: hypothetical protein ACJATI_003652 [Halioglobus sp.]
MYCNVGHFLIAGLIERIYTIAVPPFASLVGIDKLTRIQYTGSGDTPFHFYQVFLMFSLAFVGNFLLLILMRNKKHVLSLEKVTYIASKKFITLLDGHLWISEGVLSSVHVSFGYGF